MKWFNSEARLDMLDSFSLWWKKLRGDLAEVCKIMKVIIRDSSAEASKIRGHRYRVRNKMFRSNLKRFSKNLHLLKEL